MADEEVAEEEEVAPIIDDTEILIGTTTEKPLAPPKYEVRPGLGEKFQSQNVREIILEAMQSQLTGRQYRADQAAHWSKVIANAVRQKVCELDMKRYKIMAQSTIIEMKGAGVKCAQRCIWDPETDTYVDDIFKNESLFCYTIVYGVYMY
ncbi:dynein light chain Tctex-type protein 2B-like [Plodia interpunctella]|uniref:dynein light chain Tctex-type protein 2B-like n=1 Tax=Plodia interpunctella TaxID=58824 RepID=UPI002367515E|nr:dynein light chain Tctex-type protein 2B-like [Plodia interpunctella]XP_053601079.1 dynein light chain Tctex-type protein 2B-like [Plodia interpunctella]XP_053601080.1 dynein light chain Tctex-type protein 2B-like [Plodia interpunctella]